jgi:hypothetical protein
MRAFLLAAAGAVLLSPVAAVAAPAAAGAAIEADARCMLTMAALAAQTTDDKRQESARIAVGFFAGRVKARDPGYDFTTRLKPLAARLDRPHLETELKRCGPLVQAPMTQLEAAFRALSPPAASKPPPAAAPKE